MQTDEGGESERERVCKGVGVGDQTTLIHYAANRFPVRVCLLFCCCC